MTENGGVLELETEEVGELFEFTFQKLLAANFAALFFGVVFVSFEFILAKEGVEQGTAFLGRNVFAGFLQIFAVSHVSYLEVHQKTLECVNEQQHLMTKGVFKTADVLICLGVVDEDGAVRIKLSDDGFFVDGEDGRRVDGVGLAVALPNAGPDFVQRTEDRIFRKRESSDDEAPNAVFAVLFVNQFPCHFFRLCS